MVGYNGTLLLVIVVRVLHMIDTKIVERGNTHDIEQQDATGFSNEGDLDAVEAEANSLTRAEHTTENSDVMREFLWGVCERAYPVIHDVVPELLVICQ